MPGVDLSRLNRPEMRRLLAAAEARQNHALAERLRAELASRGAQVGAHSLEPMGLVTGSFDDVWGLEPAGEALAPVRRGPAAAVIFGAGAAAALAIATGWQLSRPSAPPAFPAPLPIEVAPLLAPLPAPTPQLPAPATAQPVIEPAAKPARVERRATPARASAKVARAAQDRRMLRAYNRARAAGIAQLTLDGGQARFRTTLARTRDPARVEQLYAQRIRELNAATRRRR